jgi:hypothetical protein
MQKMKGKLLYNEPDWWLTHPSHWSTERSIDAAGPEPTLIPSKGSRRGDDNHHVANSEKRNEV